MVRLSGRILVGVDGSNGSRAALLWALHEATVRRSVIEAAIVLQSPQNRSREVHLPGGEEEFSENAKAQFAETIAETARAYAAVDLTLAVLEGDPAPTLCERAADADLLVVDSRGHGAVTGLLLGSVSSKCAHHSPVPVAIVRAASRGNEAGKSRAAGLVVGVDGSRGSVRALRWAISEGETRGTSVRAVTVWRGTEVDDDMALEWATLPSLARHDRAAAENAKDRLQQVLQDVGRESAVKVEPKVLEGDPADVLCRIAARADMLVVGSRGHGGFAGLLLGSVSSKCAHYSRSPVVIVPTERDARPSPSQ